MFRGRVSKTWELAADKTDQAVLFDALHFSGVLQVIQVGDGFAHGEHGLVRVGNLAVEQHGDQDPGP